jgi:hypothetical protein
MNNSVPPDGLCSHDVGMMSCVPDAAGAVNAHGIGRWLDAGVNGHQRACTLASISVNVPQPTPCHISHRDGTYLTLGDDTQ